MIEDFKEKYPWLCGTMKDYHNTCGSTSGSLPENEQNLATTVSIDGFNLFGLKCVYYPTSHNVSYDVHFGEDQLEYITRAFNFIAYVEQMPSNVRQFQLEGIWGQDLVQMFVAAPAFRYFSTYGGSNRNTELQYDQMIPRIEDIIYIPANKTFYSVRDVKFYNTPMGLKNHTYQITLRLYKDTNMTIKTDDPTLSDSTDPIYQIASSSLQQSDPIEDNVSINDELENLKDSKNNNLFNFKYDKNELN